MKGSKYLKYAIGEIFLVVAGILIAFSMNSWNDNRKERKFEQKMLSQIKQSLTDDISYFESNINRLTLLDSSIDVFLGLIEKKVDFINSLYDRPRGRSYYLATGIIYQYNPGPYEALEATGVDKIRSDSLRNALIDLYDFEYPRNKEFVEYYEEPYQEQMERFFGFQGEPFIEMRTGKRAILQKYPTDLLRNPEFLILLNDLRSRANLEMNGLRGFIRRQKEVLKLLNSALNSTGA